MKPGTLLSLLVALALAPAAIAQPAAVAQPASQKPKPAKKAPVAVKPTDKKAPAPTPIPPPPPPPPPTDVTFHTKYVSGAQVSENATAIKGVRQRFEFPGVTMITQCDLKRSVQLNDATKHFMVVSTETAAVPPSPVEAPPDPQAAAASPAGSAAAKAKPQGGVIAETITLTDTGERKQMFGLDARRITTTTVRQPGPKACDMKTTRVETDGWYVDLPKRDACVVAPAPILPTPPASAQTCTDKVETQQTGDAKLGFALSTTITTTIEDGKEKEIATTTMEVADLQITSLEASLFDVPAGYTEVKSYQELIPSLSRGGSLADAVFGSLADGTSTLAPKKPGVIRIGVVDPIDKSGRSIASSPMLRGGLVSSFNKAPFESVPIAGSSAAELDRDAAGKACDFILVTDIAEVKTSKPNKVGGALRRVSGDANAANEIHDARIDYKLYAVGDQAKPKLTATAKASSGGGFGVGSALRVAMFAGQMYMTMGMGMGGMGGMMGMMGPASSLSGLGGMGGGASGLMNPGIGAAMSIMSAGSGMAAPGAAGDSSEKIAETVQEALSKAGKQVADELKKGKSR